MAKCDVVVPEYRKEHSPQDGADENKCGGELRLDEATGNYRCDKRGHVVRGNA